MLVNRQSLLIQQLCWRSCLNITSHSALDGNKRELLHQTSAALSRRESKKEKNSFQFYDKRIFSDCKIAQDLYRGSEALASGRIKPRRISRCRLARTARRAVERKNPSRVEKKITNYDRLSLSFPLLSYKISLIFFCSIHLKFIRSSRQSIASLSS